VPDPVGAPKKVEAEAAGPGPASREPPLIPNE